MLQFQYITVKSDRAINIVRRDCDLADGGKFHSSNIVAQNFDFWDFDSVAIAPPLAQELHLVPKGSHFGGRMIGSRMTFPWQNLSEKYAALLFPPHDDVRFVEYQAESAVNRPGLIDKFRQLVGFAHFNMIDYQHSFRIVFRSCGARRR